MAVLTYVSKLLRDRERALDVAQDTFLRAYRYRASYDPGAGTVRGWIFAIASNQIRVALEKRNREPESLEEDHDIAASGDDGLEVFARGCRRESLLAALEELPPEYREVITLKYLNDLSYKEIIQGDRPGARTLGRSHHHAIAPSSRCSRAEARERMSASQNGRCIDAVVARALARTEGLHGLFAPAHEREIEAHVRTCTRCQRRIELARVEDRALNDLRAALPTEPPRDFIARTRRALDRAEGITSARFGSSRQPRAARAPVPAFYIVALLVVLATAALLAGRMQGGANERGAPLRAPEPLVSDRPTEARRSDAMPRAPEPLTGEPREPEPLEPPSEAAPEASSSSLTDNPTPRPPASEQPPER
jgi:RNA polymerase sigma factor (sigma-70 family)